MASKRSKASASYASYKIAGAGAAIRYAAAKPSNPFSSTWALIVPAGKRESARSE
jgi:hypothetical protein